ncbi:hypothetical protein M271_20260 [Streptomyces rapamycinicus NRRL 5491]|nr:hypothetical protein M271_20260 [Streptomyces rapamycinicus NRRL 5491]
MSQLASTAAAMAVAVGLQQLGALFRRGPEPLGSLDQTASS